MSVVDTQGRDSEDREVPISARVGERPGLDLGKLRQTKPREDARGAVLGGVALAAFAAVTAISVDSLNPAVALLVATVAWFAVALLGYAAAWLK